jgi:protein phosphatase
MFLKSWNDGCALLAVVADGMGGHASGEVAAQIAVDTFSRLLENPLPIDKKERYNSLMDCFGEADAIIREQSAQDIHLQGMGTTAVAAIITPQECLFLYAGDSRLYHIRNEAIRYVTPDHTIIRLLMETGRIKPEDIATHPMRSVITSCLGGGQNTRLTVEPNWLDDKSEHNPAFISFEPGDLIILCSDGLYNEVIDERLIGLTLASNDPDELCKALVKEARDAGGHDNITVIAVRILEL